MEGIVVETDDLSVKRRLGMPFLQVLELNWLPV